MKIERWHDISYKKGSFVIYQVFEVGSIGPWGSPTEDRDTALAEAQEDNDYYKRVGRKFIVKSRKIGKWMNEHS